MKKLSFALRQVVNVLGYSLARKDTSGMNCPELPAPSPEAVSKASAVFRNTFDIAPSCPYSREELERGIREYFWHYPFRFGDVDVEADPAHFRGLEGRHYQRYLHFFPAVLSQAGGSLSGKRVLEIGCNAGFWCIQARLAGADYVQGVDVSEKNAEQARFIRDIIGLDNLDYRALNATEVSPQILGEYDVVLFLGLLYHLDKPIEALERLYAVTREFAVIDTNLARSDVSPDVPVLKLEEDQVHEQNVSNRVALVPTKSAVPVMLKYVGFREVYWISNRSESLPLDYRTLARMTYIAVK